MIIEGLKMNPEKIWAVMEFPIFTNTTEILAFQRLAGYYQQFIHKFLEISALMMNLLKKDKSFKWMKAQE